MSETTDRYHMTYSQFTSPLSAEMRREVYGEDIGQNSWLTAEEQIRFARRAGFDRNTRLLEVGCGSGGPALFLARSLGLSVTGVDINQAGIAAANEAAARAGLAKLARFVCLDGGSGMFPFEDGSFDAAQSIDAINHIPDRTALLHELHRLLKAGGALLYTDPMVLTGAISSEEIAARSSVGVQLLVPPDENERLLEACGFDLVAKENVTANTAMISERWAKARESRRSALVKAEGEEAYERSVRFSRMVHALSSSGRLSRFMFLARRR